MAKAQGALEYLIIIAAVLAIAAVVVMFLTGTLSSGGSDAYLAMCKEAATRCYTGINTQIYTIDMSGADGQIASAGVAYLKGGAAVEPYSFGCQEFCMEACKDSSGNDVISGVAVDVNTCRIGNHGGEATGCGRCAQGEPTLVVK